VQESLVYQVVEKNSQFSNLKFTLKGDKTPKEERKGRAEKGWLKQNKYFGDLQRKTSLEGGIDRLRNGKIKPRKKVLNLRNL